MTSRRYCVVRAPHRIGLIGGGTDIKEFFSLYGGGVVNMAIDKYVYVTVKRHGSSFGERFRFNYSRTEICQELNEIGNDIIREACRYFQIDFPLYVETCSDLQSGSGLGSSSAFCVGLVQGLAEVVGIKLSRPDLMEIASLIEIEMVGKPIGLQDQLASVYGGINFFRFLKSGEFIVHPLRFSPLFSKVFIEESSLVWSGISRGASEIMTLTQPEKIIRDRALSDLVSYTDEFYSCCLRGDEPALDRALRLIKLAAAAKYESNEKILPPSLRELLSGLSVDARFLKLCGAGGGGFIWLGATPGKGEDNMPKFLQEKFALDTEGVRVLVCH